MAMRKVCDLCGKILVGGNGSFVLEGFNVPPNLTDINEPILKFDACPNCVSKIAKRIRAMIVFKD